MLTKKWQNIFVIINPIYSGSVKKIPKCEKLLLSVKNTIKKYNKDKINEIHPLMKISK